MTFGIVPSSLHYLLIILTAVVTHSLEIRQISTIVTPHTTKILHSTYSAFISLLRSGQKYRPLVSRYLHSLSWSILTPCAPPLSISCCHPLPSYSSPPVLPGSALPVWAGNSRPRPKFDHPIPSSLLSTTRPRKSHRFQNQHAR